MKNLKINYDSKNSNIKFGDLYFNGIYIPKDIQFNNITGSSLKMSWKIDDFKIEDLEKDKINFKVEIKQENLDQKFTKVYEGSNYYCLIENLNKRTTYEIRVCTIYKNLKGLWSDIFKVKTDFISETIILNHEDKNKLLNWLSPLAKGKNIYLKLIYRRGNNMSIENFHSKCDNKGPTVIICKSKENKFGGYTNISWDSPSKYIKKYDKEPFIFSFNKNKKFEYNDKTKNHSIFLDKYNGPDFNYDLVFHPEKQMKSCYCATKQKQFAYSSEPLVGDGSYKEIDIDEIKIIKFKIN